VLSSTIITIPATDRDFEEKCVPLFAGILNDPNVKTFGARGMNQSGIDLIGRRDQDPGKPAGIQCKLKTKGHKLSAAEVRGDVRAALTITPALVELYVVTTASDDPALDRLALELSQEQRQLGRTINVQIWGWETLQQRIRADQKALNAFDPGHSPATDRLLQLGTETLALGTNAATQFAVLLAEVRSIKAIPPLPVDTARSAIFESHLDRQIDEYRDIAQTGKPKTALQLLGKLESQLPESVSAALRARVRANIGIALLKLGEEERAGRLLIEAYTLNPEDPKAIANHVLGQLLTGGIEAGLAFARDAITADPSNAGVAAFIFRGAAVS
jgi:tetratricopeptide (TPR) repeat protein